MNADRDYFLIDQAGVKQLSVGKGSLSSASNPILCDSPSCFFLLSPCFRASPWKDKKLFEEKKYDDARKLLVSVKDDHKDYAASRYYLGRIAAQFVQAYKADPLFVHNLANFYILEKRFDNAFA